MRIQALFLKNLLDYASFQNMDISALKKLMADPLVDLDDPGEMVDAEDYVTVFQKICEISRNDCGGLSIGAYLNLSSLGLVLEISLSTSSLRQGIHILEQFLEHKFPIVSCTIVEVSARPALRLESSLENEEVRKQLLNMVLCIIYRELKLMLPDKLAPEVRFPFSTEEDAGLFFSEEVAYSEDHLVLLPEQLDQLEINVNRVKEIQLLLPKFIAMLNHSENSSHGFSKKVRAMALHMCNPEIPSLKQVQNQFACSERTFQRRLTAEGNSFRSIVNEIKKELSDYLAIEKHLRTKDIAFILGYSEASAYLHAAKAWKGESKLRTTLMR